MRVPVAPLVVALCFGASCPALAQVGTRPAKEWIPTLERPERVAGMKIPDVLAKLELKPGDVVADLGAGTGLFAWPIAKAVAPGIVYAVEVDQDFVTLMQSRVKQSQVSNVRPLLGKYDDPSLPEKVDLAFFSDVLHHVANQGAYLKTVAGYLKPNGRIAVIELDATHPNSPHRDQPEQQVSKAQLDGWMTAAGLTRVSDVPLFDDKWFVIYRKR